MPALPTPCHVVSDVHLGVAPAGVEEALLAYLHALPDRAASLVINGDLFDFWFEWRHVIPRRGFRVLAALAALRERGLPVVWVAGNHDCWGGEVLREDVGLDFREEPWEGRIGAWHVRIEHGDGLRPAEDRAYRRLRRVIRHPWAIRAFRLLHPDLGSRLASGSSHASRAHRPGDAGAGLRRVAESRLATPDAPDLLVYGHSHVRALERLGGGVYANAGSWFDGPSCLVIDERTVALHRWTAGGGSAEHDELHLVDRRLEDAAAEGEQMPGGVGRGVAVDRDGA